MPIGQAKPALRRLTAVDLFAGAGGLSLGLELAGFSIVGSVERDPQAAATYKLNHPIPANRLLEENVRDVTAADLLPDGRRRLDLLAGGPPCQGFSIKGQRKLDHPGNAMLDQVLRLADELAPRAVLVENVVGLMSMASGYYFDHLITSFERIDLGNGRRYQVDFAVLNAADYEVPQNRRRLFVVALEPGREWTWPLPTSKPGDITLWDAIADLPARDVRPGAVTNYKKLRKTPSYAATLRGGSPVVLNHHTKRLEELRQQRIRVLAEGEDRRHLPEELKAGGHESKYRRLRARAPSPTVTAHMGKDLSDFIHPRWNRTLTAREAARLQGFPDAVQFVGSQASQFTQIGNAVPVPLARALGGALAAALSGQPRRRSGK
jgi:DNA (cytosine-5)-methyltransferase 1